MKSSPAVVDHVVRAHRPHEVLLAGVVDAGDVRAEPLGELDREGPRPSAGAVDQHPATRDGPLRALQGDRARLRDGRRLGERELRPACGRVRTPARRRTPRSRPSARGCRRTPRLRAGTGSPLRRPRRPRRRCPTRASGAPGERSPPIRAYAGDPRRHSQSLRLTDVAATLTRTWPAAGDGHRDVLDAQHVGRPVPVVDDRLHVRPAAHLVMAATYQRTRRLPCRCGPRGLPCAGRWRAERQRRQRQDATMTSAAR